MLLFYDICTLLRPLFDFWNKHRGGLMAALHIDYWARVDTEMIDYPQNLQSKHGVHGEVDWRQLILLSEKRPDGIKCSQIRNGSNCIWAMQATAAVWRQVCQFDWYCLAACDLGNHFAVWKWCLESLTSAMPTAGLPHFQMAASPALNETATDVFGC